MAVREPLGMRKTMLAGAVALALTGTGVALAWAADPPSPTPSQPAPSQSAPGNSGTAPGHNKADKAQRAQPLHGEGVVKNPDGTFQTILEQRGTVESVSSTAIAVKSEDGFFQTYAVNGDTRITRIPAAAASGQGASPEASPGAMGDDGKRLRPTDGTIADIATGQTVRISGVKDGETVTAKRIVEGPGDGPGMGLGRGHGPGHGLGHGPGKKMGNDNDNGNGNGNGNPEDQDDQDS